jgi:PAS domain S-box-containing protein
MDRILLLLDHTENRRLLAEWLQTNYQVMVTESEGALDEPFDLGILDGPALDRLWEQVQVRKDAEQPVFLPFLLVTARKDVRYVTRHLWRTVDELILTPLEKVELQARVEILLRARRLSLELHQRYRRLFENVPLGLYRTTPEGHILDANVALVQMLGYPNRETLMAIKATDTYVAPQDRQRWQELMERLGAVRHFEAQLRRRDGSVIWVEDNAQVVRDAEGRVLYYEGSLQDITERKRAEEALRMSEEKFARAFRNSPDIIVLTSLAEGRIVEVNDSLERATGYTHDEIIGKTTTEVPFWADPADRECYVALLQCDGRVRDLEVRFRIKSGEIRDTLLSGEIIELSDGKYILGVIHAYAVIF